MLKNERKKEIDTYYIAECLRQINTIIAKRMNGSYFKKSLAETKDAVFHPPEIKSAEKIIADVTKKARLVVTD